MPALAVAPPVREAGTSGRTVADPSGGASAPFLLR